MRSATTCRTVRARPDRRALRALCAAAALLLAVSGCAPEGVPGAPVTATPTPTTDVLQARDAAGIPGCPESDPTVEAREDGLPDVTLDCLGGDSTVRLAGLRGTPLVVNVWAQWCEPCRAEAPFLTEFAAAAESAGHEVTLLGVDYNDPRPLDAIDFAASAGWTWAHVVDPDKVLAGPLRIAGPPQTLFVTSEGVIAYRHVGAFTSAAQVTDLAREYLGVG